MKTPDFNVLAERFIEPTVNAVALMGSFARGDAGHFSDVDLVRFLAPDAPDSINARSFIVDDRLVVVSNVLPSQAEAWFTRPELASECIAGVRVARPLWDPEGIFAQIQRRAHEFVWDSDMQLKANAFAEEQMVGWVEEVHKGLEGLRRNDVGRMLNARFGLSFGMMKVARVYLGILITGDNTFYSQIVERIGNDSEWARLCRASFGIKSKEGGVFSLPEQVMAGLRLYILTADMIRNDVGIDARAIIDHTVAVIKTEIEKH
ncbi:MAG: hypothetical protein GY803_26515 [Chloroflexi bacterium]|nr:hypothetical protein [Chloroflexota bacterium]